jgi:membrane-associated phospholipid phosphatase
MLKKLILLLFSIILLSQAEAQDSTKRQSVYRFRFGVDIPIGLIALGTGGTSLILHHKKQPLTVAQVAALKPTDVNKFDRSAIYQHSKAAGIASDVFQYTSIAAPALLFIDKDVRKDWKTVMPIWMETFAMTTALTLFTKELAHRNRPYVYSDYDNGNKYSKDALSSYFSGHTSITAASTFFIAMVYADYHPHSRWKPLMWTGAAIIPALTGIMRYKAGKHYWTDVITGYAVGALVGTLTPYLHRREFHRK